MKKITKGVIGVAVVAVFLSGCGDNTYSGTVESGFDHFPENKISPNKALSIAEPYLETSFALRRKNRGSKYNSGTKEPITYVVLDKDYYYVTKDNYDAKFVNFYFDYAVKVNKNTGELILPEE